MTETWTFWAAAGLILYTYLGYPLLLWLLTLGRRREPEEAQPEEAQAEEEAQPAKAEAQPDRCCVGPSDCQVLCKIIIISKTKSHYGTEVSSIFSPFLDKLSQVFSL